MTLDPEAAAIIGYMADAAAPPYWERSADEARTMTTFPSGPAPDGVIVEHVSIPLDGRDVPARIYRPVDTADPPTVIFFHGGGWVVGDLDSYEKQVADLALASRCAWVSVAYRRAPQDRFPAAFDDASDTTRWLLDHGAEIGLTTTSWALAGDSSGANLAAAVAIARRDAGQPQPSLTVLVYPVLDTETTSPAFEENDGYLLPADAMRWYIDCYVPDEADRGDPRVAPLRVADLRGLSPTIVIAAAFDVLRDQALAYADRLTAAGNTVELIVESALPHGYWSLPIAQAQRSITEIGEMVGHRLREGDSAP